MKRIVIILVGLISIAYGQSSPTSAKTRFVNGLYVGTKLDAYFNAADSNAIYWRADSSLMAKYKGTARALAFAVSGGYIPYSDTTSLLSQVVRTFGTQTVGGNKTFSGITTVSNTTVSTSSTNGALVVGGGVGIAGALNTGANAVINTNTFGLGSGSQSILIGSSASASGSRSIVLGVEATSNGTRTIAIGSGSSAGNSSAADNVSIGAGAGASLGVASSNVMIGKDAGRFYNSFFTLQTPQNSVFLGSGTQGITNTDDNTTVIGYAAIGNGSNTVTIGNSSVTDNYFNGSVRATDSIVGAGASFTGNLKMRDNQITSVSVISVTRTVTDSVISVGIRNSGKIIWGDGSFAAGVSGVYNTADDGTVIVPKTGATRDFLLANGAGSTVLSVPTGTTNLVALGVYNATVGATNRDVFVDNTGLLGYVSSFRASKKNINPISNTDWLHKLNPVTFNYRVKDKKGNYTDSSYKELEYGLVAEEVEPVNKEMVFYDVDSSGNKKLRGVHYSKLIIPLLSVIQEQKKNADALEKRITDLEAKLEALLKLTRL